MGEREGEKHQCVVASHTPPTGDVAHNPHMCARLGIEPAILWFSGWHSIHWATQPGPHDYFVTASLYFLIPSPFLLLLFYHLPSGYHQNVLSMSFSLVCLFVYFVFRFHIWVKSYGICLFLFDLFYSEQYALSLSILVEMANFHGFFMVSHSLLCICTTSFSSIQLMVT